MFGSLDLAREGGYNIVNNTIEPVSFTYRCVYYSFLFTIELKHVIKQIQILKVIN